MRTLGKRLFLIPALVALHSGAQTLTSYTTFGEPGDTYNPSSGWLVNGALNPPEPYVGEAFAFTATASGYLNQLNLALSAGNGNLASDLANIYIALNRARTFPAPPWRSLAMFPVPTNLARPPITSLTSIVNPFLQSGDAYWLCVRPALSSADVVVDENSLGVLASQAQAFSPPSVWDAEGNRTTFAFAVEVSEVPEASTTALAALGIPVLIRPLARFRKIRVSSSAVWWLVASIASFGGPS